MSIRRATVSWLIFVFALTAYGQEPDYHVTRDPAHDIYARSAFLHGHRHGYEEGFHAADQDLHLGHHPQTNDKRLKVSKIQNFRSAFGDKESFRRGYKAGFWAGYLDSYSGREFTHLPTAIAETAGSAAVNKPELMPNLEFDSGVFEGYRAASSDVSKVELRPGMTKYLEDFCRHNLVRGTSIQFCSGYGHGYVLGKLDSTRKNAPEIDNSIRVASNQP